MTEPLPTLAKSQSYTCPICNHSKAPSNTHCPDCGWVIDKLQCLSRGQLKAKILPLVKELRLIQAALA